MFEPADARPLDEFLRNPEVALSRLRASKAPEGLTVEGGPGLVVQDAESYGALVEELERARFVESLRQAHRNFEEGRSIPLDEVEARLQAKHGF